MSKYPNLDQITFSEKEVSESISDRFGFNIYFSGAQIPDFRTPEKVLGIDPGRNFGFTLIEGDIMRVYWGKMPKANQNEYSKLAYLLGRKIPGKLSPLELPSVIVEGAAYGAHGKQVGLAGIRIGFYLGAWRAGCYTMMVPPATARKEVLGHGRTKASDVMPQLDPNAADSVALALYGLKEVLP